MISIFNINNAINAANYEQFCDFVFSPQEGKFVTQDFFKRGGVIFCKTDFIIQLFNEIKESKFTYNVITHHSDYPIDEYLFNKRPKCIIKWYAINPTFNHPDLIAIPLGLKTHTGCYHEPHYMTEWFAYNINRLRNNDKRHNIYCNWNITNLERNKITQSLKANNINITHDTNIPFNEYIERMSQHKFVISPPGNGIDCHRTWEALYVGSIPIVIKNNIYNNWSDLPILQVSSYSDITQDLLDTFIKQTYSYRKLSIDYWKNEFKYVND
jgi:hypothetical protein